MAPWFGSARLDWSVKLAVEARPPLLGPDGCRRCDPAYRGPVTSPHPRTSPAPVLWTAAFLAFTAFVWIGRIRNAVNDPALDDGGRIGPVLLSLSFLVPAVVLGVLLVVHRRAVGSGEDVPVLRVGVLALAAWTTGVWVVRDADILLGGDHDAAFIVVHVALGVVSVALAALSARSLARASRRALSPA